MELYRVGLNGSSQNVTIALDPTPEDNMHLPEEDELRISCLATAENVELLSLMDGNVTMRSFPLWLL